MRSDDGPSATLEGDPLISPTASVLTADSIAAAQQIDSVAFTGRHLFVTDAFEHGFLPGVRKDYSYQIEDYPKSELPILLLDNHFHDPDLDRYLNRFHTVEPAVAVVGDAPTSDAATVLQEAIDEMRSGYSDTRFVAVPKCKAAFDIFEDDTVLGYPNGYNTVDSEEYSDPVNCAADRSISWAGIRITNAPFYSH